MTYISRICSPRDAPFTKMAEKDSTIKEGHIVSNTYLLLQLFCALLHGTQVNDRMKMGKI